MAQEPAGEDEGDGKKKKKKGKKKKVATEAGGDPAAGGAAEDGGEVEEEEEETGKHKTNKQKSVFFCSELCVFCRAGGMPMSKVSLNEVPQVRGKKNDKNPPLAEIIDKL